MKKFAAFFCCLLSTQISPFFSSKQSDTPAIQIKLSSTKIKQQGATDSSAQDIQACLELLSKSACAQEQRALTFEEIRVIMQIVMFLFLQDSDDYSKTIDILLKNGKKIKLPYSSQLFATLCHQTDPQDQTDSQDQVDSQDQPDQQEA